LSRDLRLTVLLFRYTPTTSIHLTTLSLHDALPILAMSNYDPSMQIFCKPYLHEPFNWICCSCLRRLLDNDKLRRHYSLKYCEPRSEEHTSELQSREISYAVFCLKKKKYGILYILLY